MKMQRKKAKLIKMTRKDDPFVAKSKQQCISFIWELTAELWSLRGTSYAEQRLQRDVTNIIRQ